MEYKESSPAKSIKSPSKTHKKEHTKTMRGRLLKMKETLLSLISAVQTLKKEILEHQDSIRSKTQNSTTATATELFQQKQKIDQYAFRCKKVE